MYVTLLAERAFGRLLESEEAIAALIQQAAQEYGSSDCIAISVHPDRFAEVAQARVARRLDGLKKAKLRPDPNLGPDDLVLDPEPTATHMEG